MNKGEFLKELGRKLKRLPKEEVENVLQYYIEYFEDADIGDEDDVLKVLDTPGKIASEILADYAFRQDDVAKGKRNISSIWFIILAIFAAPIALPVALALVLIILAIVLVVISISVTFSLVTLVLVGTGIFTSFLGIGVIGQGFATTVMFIGVGFILVALGLLVAILVFALVPKVVRGIFKLARTVLNKVNNKNS